MFKRIAVALDGSDAAHEAFAVALQLAKTERAQLGICSVVDPIVIAGTSLPSPAMDLAIRNIEMEAHRLVTEAVERAHQAGVRASGQTRNGMPPFEVLRYADALDADLIVMGTHGRRGLKHFLLGSVAEVILREASIPVLVVRSALRLGEKQHRERDAEPIDQTERTIRQPAAPPENAIA